MEIVTNIIRAVVFFNSVYMPFFILYRHFDSYGALKDFNNIIIEQVCKVPTWLLDCQVNHLWDDFNPLH